MIKILFFLIVVFSWVPTILAADQNYMSYVVPVRGREYWRVTKELTGLTDVINLTSKYQIPVTYLLQYDALLDTQVLENLPVDSEKGLFLEITPKLALKSFVNYPWETEKWERADKVFLSGYNIQDKQKLIDTFMQKYHETFGSYPKSVGAWHIDGWSLDYLANKYKVSAVLGVADQYVTDGYQVWGQYPGYPYYPSRGSVIEPALNESDKINMVKTQWAVRHPVLSWGSGEEFSNYSVQVNDYVRFHNLGTPYIQEMLKIYSHNISGKLAHVTLGIEAGELQPEYLNDVEEQLRLTKELKLQPINMREFSQVYVQAYPEVSPQVNVKAQVDGITVEWEASPAYRKVTMSDSSGKKEVLDMRYYHTSCYSENDGWMADNRQNLFRVVPEKLDDSYSCTKNLRPALTLKDKIRLFVGKLIPDIRISKLEGKWVLGLRTGPETLYGLDTRNGHVGKLIYNFPQLENFLSLDEYRHPSLDTYSRWQDQLKSAGFEQIQAKIKDTTYGKAHMHQLLDGTNTWENSLYIIKP